MSNREQVVLNGRYELQRRVGRGGMAEVYLARDRLLDRPVAIKILFPEFATDPSFVARFRREAQSAANLNHPNIVGVYDWGKERGTYYIVMEYVDGRSVSDILRADGPIEAKRAAGIAADAIPFCSDELEASRTLLAWAQAGDTVVLPIHGKLARGEVASLLDRLSADNWHPQQPLPTDPAEAAEVWALRAANKRLAQELEILKKAITIFSHPPTP